jgi:glycosyltransferase involved in cell wall biosynthesis
MKILYFHQHFTTPNGAGGIRSYEFAKSLLSNGHSVTIVCGEHVKLNLPSVTRNICRGYIEGIDIIQINYPYSNKDNLFRRTITFVKFAWKGVGIALREEYDLLFATSTPLTAGIPGITAKLFRRKKFVFEVRDLWPELPEALGLKNPFLLAGMSILEWLSYRLADACIGLSPGICEGIKKRSQKNKSIKMIPNGCDLELFKPSLQGPLLLEGIKPTDKVAIFAGAHGVANGLDSVLDAAAELKTMKRNDIILVFVGDGKMKQYLSDRVNKEQLYNCRFYDPVPKKILPHIIASADIGMMVLANIPAFYYGTSPNKFFDYISSGIPVLNNYPGWLADMIREKDLGIVVPPENPRAFAEGIIELANDEDRRKRLGTNARKFAEENFSREKLSDEFVSFLENVCFSMN